MTKWTIAAAMCAAMVAGCGQPVQTPESAGTPSPGHAGGRPPVAGSAVQVTFTEWSVALKPARAPKGNVLLKVTNAGKVPHGLYITGPGVDGKGSLLQPGESETQTRLLDTGEYQIIDFVGSNETEHGMTATLVVE